MINAPAANWLTIKISGRLPKGAARAVLQMHGHKSNNVPTCLSTLARCKYGRTAFGIQGLLEIHDVVADDDEAGIEGSSLQYNLGDDE